MSNSPTADLILRRGQVHTLDPRRPTAEAVAIRGGVIVAVGSDSDVAHLRQPSTIVVDLAGATLTPGLVDGHMHPVLGLQTTSGVDIGDVMTPRELRDRLAREPRTGGWVRGWNLNPNVFAGVPVTADALDEAVGDVPAFVTFADAHSALANRAALGLAGITGPREFGQGAAIVCDADGVPTGHLLEHEAMDLVRRITPAEEPAQRRDRLQQLLQSMAATGLTGGHVMDANDDSLDLVRELDESGRLPLRLRLAPWCMPEDDAEARRALVDAQERGGELWRVAGVKLFVDGTVDGGTAWLEEPDTCGDSTRSFWPDPEAYSEAVRFFAKSGVPTATHAIGDAAVRHVLDTVAKLPARGPKHRIEHIETLQDEQVSRFAELGVVASMQPTHAHYNNADQSDNWSRRLGSERALRAWRCRDLRAAGAAVVLGSDWPIAAFDPRQVLAGAQLRRPAGREWIEPIVPVQGLTASMALEGFTTHAAAAAGESAFAGRVAPGHRADLTAFAADPLAAPADEIADAPVALTVLNGRITHLASN